MKRRLIVELDIPLTEVDNGYLAQYVTDAVSSWGGQFHPEDPLFSANWDNDSVEVTVPVLSQNGVHELESGVLVSEYIIDTFLERTKGRVSRAEALELAMVADRIRKQRDHLQECVDTRFI